MANFGDYPGDFILLSGDREIQSKIWSFLGYPGELTALRGMYLYIKKKIGLLERGVCFL